MGATVGRGNNFSDIAKSVQEGVHYSCQEGWCGSCWHRELATGKVVRMCQDEVPGVWDNVMPMTLVAAPETNREEARPNAQSYRCARKCFQRRRVNGGRS